MNGRTRFLISSTFVAFADVGEGDLMRGVSFRIDIFLFAPANTKKKKTINYIKFRTTRPVSTNSYRIVDKLPM